jgi:hypothetical protein
VRRCLTIMLATLLWPVSFHVFDLMPIRPPCPDGFERIGDNRQIRMNMEALRAATRR